MPQPGERQDPYLEYRFSVEIGGVIVADFTECSGLKAETEVFEYKEGGVNSMSHKLPVRTTFGNLTLKRGVNASRDLVDWYQNLINHGWAVDDRRNVSVVVFDRAGEEVLRWNLVRALPVKWDGPAFKPDSTAVAVETLELAFESVDAVTGAS
jgi:phage tail-like protein